MTEPAENQQEFVQRPRPKRDWPLCWIKSKYYLELPYESY